MILTALILASRVNYEMPSSGRPAFRLGAYASTSDARCIATRRSGRVAAEPEEMPRPRPRRCWAEAAGAAVPGLTLFCEILYVILRSKINTREFMGTWWLAR
jgi:hypothetical protein